MTTPGASGNLAEAFEASTLMRSFQWTAGCAGTASFGFDVVLRDRLREAIDLGPDKPAQGQNSTCRSNYAAKSGWQAAGGSPVGEN